jgi:hypothetical protein
MDITDLMGILAAIVIFFIPALAVSARFALRPIVEAIIRLREAFVDPPSRPQLEARLESIEAELRFVRQATERALAAAEREKLIGAPSVQAHEAKDTAL